MNYILAPGTEQALNLCNLIFRFNSDDRVLQCRPLIYNQCMMMIQFLWAVLFDVYRGHPLGLSKNWTSEHRRTHKTIASLGNSWLEKIIKNGKLKKEGDNQRLAVVDVHFRLSLSEPKQVPDFVGRLVPRWISMLNGAQPWLPHPPQGTVFDLLCVCHSLARCLKGNVQNF